MNIVLNYLFEFLKLISLIIYYYLEAFVNLFTPKPKKVINDNLIVITGAGMGLGREIAIKFAKLNPKLALLDINQEALSQTKAYLKEEFGAEVETYVCNISVEEEVAKTFEKIGKDFKKNVNILINNAGIVNCLPFEELENKAIIRTFQVNVFAQFYTIKNVLNSMKKNNCGHIVSISSIAGYFGNANLTDYCASKFAVNGLLESLREELRQDGFNGIKITSVNPVAMNTGMFKRPTTRFASLIPIIDASVVAEKVVDGVLSNQNSFFSVPSFALHVIKFSHFIPEKVKYLIFDILDYNVKPHR